MTQAFEQVQGYVIFHEMAHSIERKHTERFWKIVARRFKCHQKMENELMIYWFLLKQKYTYSRTGK